MEPLHFENEGFQLPRYLLPQPSITALAPTSLPALRLLQEKSTYLAGCQKEIQGEFRCGGAQLKGVSVFLHDMLVAGLVLPSQERTEERAGISEVKFTEFLDGSVSLLLLNCCLDRVKTGFRALRLTVLSPVVTSSKAGSGRSCE